MFVLQYYCAKLWLVIWYNTQLVFVYIDWICDSTGYTIVQA